MPGCRGIWFVPRKHLRYRAPLDPPLPRVFTREQLCPNADTADSVYTRRLAGGGVVQVYGLQWRVSVLSRLAHILQTERMRLQRVIEVY